MSKKKKYNQQDSSLNTIHNVYFLLIALLGIISVIEFAGLIRAFVQQVDINLITGVVFTILFFTIIPGIVAIYQKEPPFHHLVHLGAFVNFIYSSVFYILSQFNSVFILQGLMSILVLYFGLRYPIDMSKKKSSFRSR